jgi:hypothetical protein
MIFEKKQLSSIVKGKIAEVQDFLSITIESEQDPDRNVLFYTVNPTKIPYSVILNFSQLQNMTTAGGGNVTGIALPERK